MKEIVYPARINDDKRKKKLIHDLKDKEYRNDFVEAGISVGIPFQIKALREQRKLTQRALEEISGMKQTRISLMEDPNYSASFSLKTLLKLASAFNTGLIVKFASFGELSERELNLSSESLQVMSFEDDPYFKEELSEEANKQDEKKEGEPTMSEPYRAFDIAEYFLFKASNDEEFISNLKLQKLVYYAQGLSLALHGKPLFSEEIEAWTYGPVVPSLHHYYKHHGPNGIPADPKFDPDSIDKDTRGLLDEIYTVFGQFSAPRLIDISHSDDCWSKDSIGNVISHEDM
ncbi:MAG: type II toxin-antitoxin system antitoxin SocA domain-containing protein, partial [Nanoarchaeota archaeon]